MARDHELRTQRIKRLESEGGRESANKIFTDLAHPNTSGAGGRYGESRARRRAEPFAYLRPNDHRVRAGEAQRGERNRPAAGGVCSWSVVAAERWDRWAALFEENGYAALTLGMAG
jgi:hypothetical protein